MNHDIYVFGSAVRGEVDEKSDIDVLVVPLGSQKPSYPEGWSVYSPQLLQDYFNKGRLFAWHLYLESHCIHAAGPIPYIQSLGQPKPYETVSEDIDELEEMFSVALDEIKSGTESIIYELGIAYTSIRDIAMSASWALLDKPCFSRAAPYMLPIPLPVPRDAYEGAMLARYSSTRGLDYVIPTEHVSQALLRAPIAAWVQELRNAI